MSKCGRTSSLLWRKVISASSQSVNLYQTTRRYIPENSTVLLRRNFIPNYFCHQTIDFHECLLRIHSEINDNIELLNITKRRVNTGLFGLRPHRRAFLSRLGKMAASCLSDEFSKSCLLRRFLKNLTVRVFLSNKSVRGTFTRVRYTRMYRNR
jgi:hypothetical protein